MSFTNFKIVPHQNFSISCSICKTIPEDDEPLLFHEAQSETLHIFHQNCIFTWLEKKSSCPDCRINITHVNGDLVEVFREKLAKEKASSPQALAYAALRDSLFQAISEGHQSDVTSLLENQFTSEDLGTALVLAVESNAMPIINLLKNRPDIPPEKRKEAICKASELDRVNLITELLNAAIVLGDNGRGWALITAATFNSLRVLEHLLEIGTYAEAFFAEAIQNAAASGNTTALQLLLARVTPGKEQLGLAICTAAENNHQESLQLLLSKGSISPESRGKATHHAAMHNSVEMVNLLLQHGAITENSRGQAVCEAAFWHNGELTRVLLASGPISQEDRAKAIQKASIFDDADELAAFLKESNLI